MKTRPPRRSPVEICSALVSYLAHARKPVTCREISTGTGIPFDTVKGWLRRFAAEPHPVVKIVGTRNNGRGGCKPLLWAWVPPSE